MWLDEGNINIRDSKIDTYNFALENPSSQIDSKLHHMSLFQSGNRSFVVIKLSRPLPFLSLGPGPPA